MHADIRNICNYKRSLTVTVIKAALVELKCLAHNLRYIYDEFAFYKITKFALMEK